LGITNVQACLKQVYKSIDTAHAENRCEIRQFRRFNY